MIYKTQSQYNGRLHLQGRRSYSHASSFTAPNPRAQADLLIAAYRKAGVNLRTVGYIEAHGTGTALGDPIEINGLKTAWSELSETMGGGLMQKPICGIGSVKSNIGHLELAAGVTGVIKVLLQMQHKKLVKSLHCERLNPYIQLEPLIRRSSISRHWKHV